MLSKWFNKKVKTLPFNALIEKEAEEAELNIYSPTWKYIIKWQEERLIAERGKNDAPHHNSDQTAYIRGRISILKDLAELPKDAGRKRPGLMSRPSAETGE